MIPECEHCGFRHTTITCPAAVALPEPPLNQVLLTGEQAIAYQEYAAACRELEGLFKAYNAAKERHQVALAKFTKLAAASG